MCSSFSIITWLQLYGVLRRSNFFVWNGRIIRFIAKGKISNDVAAALEKEKLNNYQALMDFSEYFEQNSPGLKMSIAQKELLRQALANLKGNADIAEKTFSSPATSKDLQNDTKLNEFLNSNLPNPYSDH